MYRMRTNITAFHHRLMRAEIRRRLKIARRNGTGGAK